MSSISNYDHLQRHGIGSMGMGSTKGRTNLYDPTTWSGAVAQCCQQGENLIWGGGRLASAERLTQKNFHLLVLETQICA